MTAKVKAVATAASMAFPPCLKISDPQRDAIRSSETTSPRVATVG